MTVLATFEISLDLCGEGGIHQEIIVPVDSNVYLHVVFVV